MKKLLSLFVPLLALFLTLAPQTARADYVDDNLTQPLTIEFYSSGVSGTAVSGQFKIYYVGKKSSASTSTSKTTPNLQYRLQTQNPSTKAWSAWGNWTAVMTNGTTQLKALASGISVSSSTLGGGSSPYKAWRVQLRGVNNSGWSTSTTDYFTISLESSSSTRNMTVSGNIMSLIVGYDSDNETAAQAALAAADEIPNEYCFYRLFHYISGISAKCDINCSNLIFPATKLKSHCYEDMFLDNTGTSTYGLTHAPTYLATDFKDKDNSAVSSSFAGLCRGCKKLTSIHVNFQHCYEAGENNLTNWLNTGATSPYPTLYAPEAFRTCAVNNSGLSNAVWNNWTKTEWSKAFVSHTITFKDANGTIVETKEVTEGSIPTYTGTTNLNIQGKVLKWSPALVAVTEDAEYQAYYVDEPDYFTITNTSSKTATIYLDRRSTGTYTNNNLNVAYSINGGEWTEEITYGTSDHNQLSISLPAGQSVRFRGYNLKDGAWQCGKSKSIYFGFNFPTSGTTFTVSGELMSLVAYKEDELHTSEYPMGNYCFTKLFNSCNKITDASGLKLSATTLSDYCYKEMFNGCSALTTAPQMSATTLAQYCYQSMFNGCVALAAAPSLPATTLTPYCYSNMFIGCSALTAAPQLNATTLTEGCYQNMFQNCTSLTDVQETLPGTNLPQNCYAYMFSGCSALTTAPEIMASANTIPGMGACDNMFASCTSLTKAPSQLLPETVNSNLAYGHMFFNCPLLTEGPDIHATTISDGGTKLQYMFSTASNLRKIRVYFPAWGSMTFCSYWTNSVAATGDFYCPPALARRYNNNEQTPSYIPTGWTVYSYNVTFVPVECSWEDATNTNKQFTWKTDTSDVNSFLRAEAGAKFYTNEACTNEITISEIQALLPTQQELSAETTKYIYARKVSSYALSWDANGGALSGDYTVAGDYEAGATITAPTATRAGYTYTWNPTFTGKMPAANTTYTAQWTQKSYTLDATADTGGSGVTRSDNGNSETVKRYGDNVVLTPVANTGYHFTDWTGTDADDLVDNEDGTYTLTIADKADNYEYTVTANFAPNTHRLTWTTDGNTLTGDYTHGEAIAYGTTIIAPNTPTKNATAQYTYTFNGWEPALDATMPDNDVTYTATWTETKRQYTLTWDVNGGNALTGTYTNGTIDWGTDIVKPADPTKSGYTFGGWDADNDGTADEVAETMPTTSLTYKAIWVAELPNITLCEYCDNSHYNTFKSDYDGETVNVTYPRRFSASKWSTMCLPFSIELPEMIAQKMYGRVYEFKYATGNANTNSGVNLYFSNAKKIEAGKCYIVNANDALAAKNSFVFSGVTIDLTNDKGAALTSVGAYDNLPGYKSEGTIELVGTLRNGTLKGSATGNKYMGLKNNKIYYPNTDTGSTIWAYRGIFRSSEILDKQSMQKMRIIVDGEDRGELIIDADGDILAPSDAPSRKFIRDGVLYIEREGVVYDAQGKRVEGAF